MPLSHCTTLREFLKKGSVVDLTRALEIEWFQSLRHGLQTKMGDQLLIQFFLLKLFSPRTFMVFLLVSKLLLLYSEHLRYL